MTDTRLIPVTREQREDIERAYQYSAGIMPPSPPLVALLDAFDAASEPVTRLRCSTHEAEYASDTTSGIPYCWKAARVAYEVPCCAFVEEWCVPKPEVAS